MENEYGEGKMVIALLGAPHSGKSVFVAKLYQDLLANPEIGSKRAFLQRACPDGEGMWSAESDPETVQRIRLKGAFTPEVVNFYLNSLDGLKKTKDIVLADCGGLKSLENIMILAHCTDSIILSSNPEKMEQWTQFCDQTDEIIQAVKSGDVDKLLEFQQSRIVEVIPEGKMANYPDPELLRAEIEKRLTILHENFEGSVSKLSPHKIGVIAQLGSRLLTAEQRAELDQQIQAGEPISKELESSLDTQTKPWQGEMLDLDRDRGNQTYEGATRQFSSSLGELSTERTNEFQLQREPGMQIS